MWLRRCSTCVACMHRRRGRGPFWIISKVCPDESKAHDRWQVERKNNEKGYVYKNLYVPIIARFLGAGVKKTITDGRYVPICTNKKGDLMLGCLANNLFLKVRQKTTHFNNIFLLWSMVGNTNGSAIGRTIPFLCYAIVLGQKQQGGGWISTCRWDPFTVSPPPPKKKENFIHFCSHNIKFSVPNDTYCI